jgi:hypothetical protein
MRLQHMLDELDRRPLGSLVQPASDLPLEAALKRVHSADYLNFICPRGGTIMSVRA